MRLLVERKAETDAVNDVRSIILRTGLHMHFVFTISNISIICGISLNMTALVSAG